MVDTITGKLESLVLSAVEVQSLTNWPDEMVEDYLNIIRNLALIAQIVDENDLEIIQNIQKLQQQVEVDNSFIKRLSALISALRKEQDKSEQLAYSLHSKICSLSGVIKSQSELIYSLSQTVGDQASMIGSLRADIKQIRSEVKKNRQLIG